ncbi:MAG TPA: DUF805 domain-containing protein [Stellaceae bacterium]|nr:DUF805 domain-containing protein [Stellaceae bacterium]
MDFSTAVRKVLQENYANFQGRAARSEYWWFFLFVIIVDIAVSILSGILGAVLGNTGAMIGSLISIVFLLAIIVPGIAVTVRRLHDLDRSGWWIFISLVPLIGPILLIIWYCTKGSLGPNRFGNDPLGAY